MRAISVRCREHGSARYATGRAGRRSNPVEAPPDLKAGQVRCPVCRNGARLNVRGFLRAHCDLFGLTCYNRRPPSPG